MNIIFIYLFIYYIIINRNYLESLSSNLYDYLRPMIIHENRIDTLSELCRILLSNLTEINTISHRKKEDYELKLSFLVINNVSATLLINQN